MLIIYALCSVTRCIQRREQLSSGVISSKVESHNLAQSMSKNLSDVQQKLGQKYGLMDMR